MNRLLGASAVKKTDERGLVSETTHDLSVDP